jgi:hypothetical protein
MDTFSFTTVTKEIKYTLNFYDDEKLVERYYFTIVATILNGEIIYCRFNSLMKRRLLHPSAASVRKLTIVYAGVKNKLVEKIQANSFID